MAKKQKYYDLALRFGQPVFHADPAELDVVAGQLERSVPVVKPCFFLLPGLAGGRMEFLGVFIFVLELNAFMCGD